MKFTVIALLAATALAAPQRAHGGSPAIILSGLSGLPSDLPTPTGSGVPFPSGTGSFGGFGGGGGHKIIGPNHPSGAPTGFPAGRPTGFPAGGPHSGIPSGFLSVGPPRPTAAPEGDY